MKKLQVKLSGIKGETNVALAIIEAGGSDEIKPPKPILDAAFAKIGNGSGLAVAVVEDSWIALRGRKPGLTLYHFYAPVELV